MDENNIDLNVLVNFEDEPKYSGGHHGKGNDDEKNCCHVVNDYNYNM